MSSRLLPPQSPCSEQDVASYSQLVIHLRSQPELARENEKLLNAEALADLTEGVRQFQHAHLGRVSGVHVISRSEHLSEHKRVVQFHAVFVRPPAFSQMQQTSTSSSSSTSRSHISHAHSTAFAFPSTHNKCINRSTYVDLNSTHEPCSGQWSVSPTRYSAIGPGADLSSRLFSLPIERRTAPRGVHSTCPIPRGKNALMLVRERGHCACVYLFMMCMQTQHE